MYTHEKKLIFFDIDGTIITEGIKQYERIIPESFPAVLKKLQDNGHLCFINTGRTYAEVEEKIRNLAFDGYVCGCGTYIQHQDDILLHNTLPEKLKKDLLLDLEEHHLEWLLEGSRFIYYNTNEYSTHIGDFKREHQILVPDAVKTISADTGLEPEFDKFCICLGKEHQFEAFQKKYEQNLTFIDRGNGFYEIVPLHFSKASGIRFLEEYFHIDHKNTISIGDSTNDLPMLSYTAYSICMGNGAKELFDVVDYVTDSVIEDGVLHAMQHLQLI